LPGGTSNPFLIADLNNLESVIDPSHQLEINVILRSKSQAIVTLMLSVFFLCLKGADFSEAIEIGMWVPSMAPRQFLKNG